MHAHRRAHKTLGVAVVAGVLITPPTVLVLASTPVAAHAALVRSSPQDGSTLAREPTLVELVFDDTIGRPAYVVVTAPDGSQVSRGEPQVLNHTVTQTVDAAGLAGRYTMAYRVVSTDGHAASGELTYTVTAGAPVDEADAVPAAASEDGASFWHGHWPHLIIAVGGALIAFVIVPRWRRG